MARRILNRKDLRADFDAAERRKTEEEDQDEVEDEDESEAGEEEESASDENGEGDGEEVIDEDQPAKRKLAVKSTRSKPRSRAAKVARLKVVWGVFNNANQRVATFDYPKRQDADDLATKLSADKKMTHFVLPVKEPIEEKKEA